jgi:SSS family solute:Na+ symporter
MKTWLILFTTIYIFTLAYSAYKSKKSIKTSKDYALPQIGLFLGFLTFSASLFSTFTLMGMPDFFRNHGVGAWIFLGVTDTALAFVLLWFGTALRKKYSKENFNNVSSIIRDKFNSNLAVFIYQIGIFIFLIPYVAIQIKGVSEFVGFSQILNIPSWVWASIFLIILLVYSYIGGMKAIIVSDAIQGIVLLIVTIIISITCVQSVGGMGEMFQQLSEIKPKLLSTPGPKGLLSSQFLLASFVTIILMPISQPQLLTRIVIMKSLKETKKMAIAVSIFAFIIIFCTIFIGFYGAIKYGELNTQNFLFNSLVSDQHAIVGALAIIGLIAASMSTTDSQLFAIQAEVVQKKSKLWNKFYIIIFGLIALFLSIYSSQELVLLARVSFAGTALLAPMIFIALFSKYKQSLLLPITTLISLILYLTSNLSSIIPTQFIGIRIDIILLLVNSLMGIFVYNKRTKTQ